MRNRDISERFYREIFRLMDWDYTEKNIKDKRLFLQAFTDKYIYKQLDDSMYRKIINKAKHSGMSTPPLLHHMIDIKEVQQQTLLIVEKSQQAENVSDLEIDLNNIPDHDSDPVDFDKLLKAFLAVPKDFSED